MMKNNIIKYGKKTLLGLLMAFVALWAMTNTYDVSQYTMKKGDRTIVFQGMIHYADKDFFDKINNEILTHKKAGYNHYYEMIQLDGVQPEEFGSFLGIPEFDPSAMGLSSQIHNMHISNEDINADITAKELMDLPAEALSVASVNKEIFPRSLVLGVKASITLEETLSFVFGADRSENLQDVMLSLYAGNDKAEHIIGYRNNVLIDFVNVTNDNLFITYGEAHWVDFRDKMIADGWEVVSEKEIEAINNM